MKFMYYTNNIIYVLTLVLYTTIIFGMYMQVLLGIVQVLFFLILLFNYGKFSKTIQLHLKIYGIITTAFLIIFWSLVSNTSGSIIFFFVVPMLIGTYFTYIIYKLNQQVL